MGFFKKLGNAISKPFKAVKAEVGRARKKIGLPAFTLKNYGPALAGAALTGGLGGFAGLGSIAGKAGGLLTKIPGVGGAIGKVGGAIAGGLGKLKSIPGLDALGDKFGDLAGGLRGMLGGKPLTLGTLGDLAGDIGGWAKANQNTLLGGANALMAAQAMKRAGKFEDSAIGGARTALAGVRAPEVREDLDALFANSGNPYARLPKSAARVTARV